MTGSKIVSCDGGLMVADLQQRQGLLVAMMEDGFSCNTTPGLMIREALSMLLYCYGDVDGWRGDNNCNNSKGCEMGSLNRGRGELVRLDRFAVQTWQWKKISSAVTISLDNGRVCDEEGMAMNRA
ncbi:hypothetical protein F0562_025454 [Nyssa sinensis]|uniref:Uncharacterized protein n=1 Tax=Nyssa sinensis TaxID=561372 RepID=A0A5J5BJZ7_9ASTE|nr:hypothetical protein F0562_025454 [Nyssa sinensis]